MKRSESSSSDSSSSSLEDTAGKSAAAVSAVLADVDEANRSRRNSVNDIDTGSLTPKEVAALWKHKLCKGPPEPALPSDMDEVVLDEPNQRVIRYDCERTRGTLEEFRDPDLRQRMEQILTLYCKTHQIKYKQGMNEVLAPFVYLKLVGAIPNWQEVYWMYKCFIDIFLFSMFSDDEFQFLQKCCVLFKTCLRYHAPALSSRLDAAMVTPEMFVTPWFLTLFASKTSMASVLHLWDLIIKQGDRWAFVFVSVSLCVAHARILRASAKSSLPETITKISVTEDAVSSVWRRSVRMRQHTPPYFIQQLIDAIDTNIAKNTADENAIPKTPPPATYLEKQLGDVVPMYIRPMDLFRVANKEGYRYVVLDCRPEWMISSSVIGSLPLSIPFDLESLVVGQQVFPVSEALKRVADLLGVDVSDEAVPQWPVENHVCVMGLGASVIDATGLLYLALAKFSNIPRVSILRGGFEAVHNDVPQELIDHEPSSCPLCNQVPVTQISDRRPPPARPRAASNASSSFDSNASSPVSAASPAGGSLLNKFRSFVQESSAVASGTGSFLLSTGSRFLVGTAPPLPTSKSFFFPSSAHLTLKCKLNEILGKTPSSDIEANALLVVSGDSVRCYAAPLDMTVLTTKCELRLYGGWRMTDVCKVTSRNQQPATLMLYFSVEAAPDLIVTMINADVAKTIVDDIRRKYRLAKAKP